MTKRQSLFVFALTALAALAPTSALAGEGEGLLEANTHLSDPASLQRGAKLFMNYCSGCHSLKYLRYGRIADDLGLSEKQVQENLNFTGAKYLDHVNVAMNPTDAANWFGKTPPDLSLEGRARGPNWIYTYLKSFYADESRPSGWNNTILPNASMPNVLWQLQGVAHPVTEPKHGDEPCAKGEFEGKCIKDLAVDDAHKGQLTPEEYDRAALDITAFLQYAAEPAALQRTQYGWKVILFLAFFTFLAYLLKREYWRDVH